MKLLFKINSNLFAFLGFVWHPYEKFSFLHTHMASLGRQVDDLKYNLMITLTSNKSSHYLHELLGLCTQLDKKQSNSWWLCLPLNCIWLADLFEMQLPADNCLCLLRLQAASHVHCIWWLSSICPQWRKALLLLITVSSTFYSRQSLTV